MTRDARLHRGCDDRRIEGGAGFCAESGAAFAILLSTHLSLPVSATHCLAGSIAGVGAVQRLKAVRWPVLTNIAWAWVLTVPAAALASR